MSRTFRFSLLALSLALTVRPCLSQTDNNLLKGAHSVGILVEELGQDATDCNLSRGSIAKSAKYPFSSARFKLVDPLAEADHITFYIAVSTLYFSNVDSCVSALRLAAYYDQNVKLEFSERSAFAKVILWEEGKIISSQRFDHEQLISQSIEDLAKQFVTAWNLDNKDHSGALTFDEFMPKARKGPYDDLIPKKGKSEYDDIPFGFTRGPPPSYPPGVKPVTAAELPKPPVNAASNPSASSTLADSNAPKPDAKTQPEVVTVKYRGPVSLAPFKCDAITRSSFIERVCYDAANSYMLIDLNGTWYHYCEIDASSVSNLMAADSMGRFYNQSIKGRFDCRTHRVPSY